MRVSNDNKTNDKKASVWRKMMSLLSRRRVYLKYGIWTKFMVPRLKYKMYDYNPDNIKKIQDFLCKFDTKTVATFVGLKQLKYSLGLENAFEQTYDLLTGVYESLIVPTFTYSTRDTKYYDVLKTHSELGAFSRLFTEVSDYRSLAPIKSYAIKGPAAKEFSLLDYKDDYEKNGSYEYFGTANAITLNIGTDVLRPVRTHQLEYYMGVPYLKKIHFPVTIIDHSGVKHEFEVADLVGSGQKVKLNCSKWERDMLKNGILHHFRVNDLLIRILPTQEYVEFFNTMLKKNPYYLVD